MPRAVVLLSTALAALVAGAGAAEDTPGRPEIPSRPAELIEQWKPGLPASEALTLPPVITRDEEVERVSLKQAIALALENNPAIAAQRLEPVKQDEGVLGAQSAFDPTLAGELNQNHSIVPNASALAGTRTLNTDDRNANFHLIKQFRTSTVATFDFLNQRLDQNARFNELRPQYIPELNLSVVQPLLRNFGWDFSYLVVRVAEQTADAAYYTYQAQLADFVTTVIVAYWNVVRARETVEVQRESLALAEQTVRENEARVRVGLLPPVAVLEAQADAKSREDQLIVAQNDLDVSRQQLAQLVYYRPAGTFVPRTLEPVEGAESETVAVNLDTTLSSALTSRPEIQASAHGIKARQLDEKIAGNGLLPRLDLVGSYGLNGLSGNGRPASTTFLSSIELPEANCVPITSPSNQPLFVCTQTVVSPFVGSRGDAYNRLVSGDFKQYSFGVQFQMPLSNAGARSDYAQRRIARDQAELNHRDLLSRITLEVRQTVADVVASRQRIDTSRVARELAAENLRNQEKRHEVGMATTKDLLDFQTRLTTARAAEVAAHVDHAISVARLRRAEGQLLTHYQVVIEQPGKRSVPWFARF